MRGNLWFHNRLFGTPLPIHLLNEERDVMYFLTLPNFKVVNRRGRGFGVSIKMVK